MKRLMLVALVVCVLAVLVMPAIAAAAGPLEFAQAEVQPGLLKDPVSVRLDAPIVCIPVIAIDHAPVMLSYK